MAVKVKFGLDSAKKILKVNYRGLVLLSLIFIIVLIAMMQRGYLGNLSNNKSETRKTNDGAVYKDQEVTTLDEKSLSPEFPSDFPIYPEAKLASSWTTENEGDFGVSAIWEVSEPFLEVVEYYKRELSAREWKITDEFENQGSYTIAFEKGKWEGFMGIAFEDKTLVSVTMGTQK